MRGRFLVIEPLAVLDKGWKAGAHVVQACGTQSFHMWVKSREFSIIITNLDWQPSSAWLLGTSPDLLLGWIFEKRLHKIWN